MTPFVVLGLVVAGGVGASARFVVDGVVTARLRATFPWATLMVNLSGSLLLGVITGFTLFRGGPAQMQAVLGTGFCGGYTTFSTASAETVALARRGSVGAAFGNLLGSAGLCVVAAALGLFITS